MTVLVTGATGFIGRAFVARAAAEYPGVVRAAVRRESSNYPSRVSTVHVGELDAATDWSAALTSADVVVHTAARVHLKRDISVDPLAEFRRVNVGGTLHLATQAASRGVRRFIFISSVKVNGEETVPGRPFAADDKPAPVDPYGISKTEAEFALRGLSRKTGMDVVIIRPVLVYGPGVKGNFLSMMRWLDRGLPLPFGSIHNQRSLVSLDNLIDLILKCVGHPAAKNQTFLVSDGEDMSTTELLRRTARAMMKEPRLIPVPESVVRRAASVLGRAEVGQRLCGSLQVDISKTCRILAWTPPDHVNAALERTVHYYQAMQVTNSTG
jgi:nucleoside-diphosphate-sugar epimerase